MMAYNRSAVTLNVSFQLTHSRIR